jgi:hypothetical protein
MASPRKLPFKHMTPIGWQNLALAALLIFYLIQISFDLFWHTTCGHLAIDYCAFWSAGKVVNTNGYSAVYNLQLLGEVQKTILPRLTATSPTPFLPIFIPPFQLLALLDIFSSFWIWTILNLIVIISYLYYLSRQWTDKPLSVRFILMIAISLPVFINIFTGQINAWLMICVGEFMRAILAGKTYKAGIWLGGLLLKPQTLLLIIPFLAIQRAYKVLAGWVISSSVLMGISFALVGFNGLQKLLDLWIGFVGGLPTNDVEIMMNWRMLGLHLSALASPLIGWVVVGLGSIATLLACIYLWRSSIDFHSKSFVFAFLGIMAATCLFAWHSHIHMAMILIPPLVYLKGQNQLSDKILNYWVFLPAGVYAGVFVLASLMEATILPTSLNWALNFLRGGSEFTLNIYLLIWAIGYFRKQYVTLYN